MRGQQRAPSHGRTAICWLFPLMVSDRWCRNGSPMQNSSGRKLTRPVIRKGRSKLRTARAVLLVAVVSACHETHPSNVPQSHRAAKRHAAQGSTTASGEDERGSPAELQLSRSRATIALCRLYSERDLDHDRRITVIDERARCGQEECPSQPVIHLADRVIHLGSLAQVSQLASDLADGILQPSPMVHLRLEETLDDPVSYLARRIQSRYWPALTRRIAPSGDALWLALGDEKQGTATTRDVELCVPGREPQREKSRDALRYLYVPEGDHRSLMLYGRSQEPARIAVGTVPRSAASQWVQERDRDGSHGLLALALDSDGKPLPFLVPGGRFNEMYGWDSFFITWGLLEDEANSQLARAMLRHQLYELKHYGKVLNANRTYYLTRSQPPFLTALTKLVGGRSGSGAAGNVTPSRQDAELIAQAHVAAEDEYHRIWGSTPHRTSLCDGDVCLSRYYGEGKGQPSEVEPGHFQAMYQAHAIKHGHCPPLPHAEPTQKALAALLDCTRHLEAAYVRGTLSDPELDAHFTHDRCVRESGHDTTFRWHVDGQERCTDFVTVELNSLLLRYELDLAEVRNSSQNPAEAARWCARAKRRAQLMKRYLWDPDAQLFFDYNVATDERSHYLSATTLFPLWGAASPLCAPQLLTDTERDALVSSALVRLEAPGGLLATDPQAVSGITPPQVLVDRAGHLEFVEQVRQWEAPNGWAPHQMIAWAALKQAGYEAEAQRLIYRWLFTIVSNAARFHGTVPEKFDVVARSHRVFAEYGNVNTDFSYIAQEGFGWMNASFLVGLGMLSPTLRSRLEALEPPEAVFAELPRASQTPDP